MSRIDLESLGKEYGLHVEKSDGGRYGQFKDAVVMLYLDSAHTGSQAMVSGACMPQSENISIWSSLYCDRSLPGVPRFHRHMVVCDDDFNLRFLRKTIEEVLSEYRGLGYGDSTDDK